MNYTTEQLVQIEKVREVFKSFITNSPGIDLVWSPQIGYVYYNFNDADFDQSIFETNTPNDLMAFLG